MSRPDLDLILSFLVPFAKEQLQKHGEFYPFAAEMPDDERVSAVSVHLGSDHPESREVVESLVEVLKKRAEEAGIRASGICIDVRVIPPGKFEMTDAIMNRLEHRDGEAVDVYLPYRRGFLGRLKYGELFALKGTVQIFLSGAGTLI